MKRLAIIPARGGSKRIPRKNIKSFLGQPIIAYSIETALHSGLFSEVMVSTDDEEIAEVAKSYGATIPFFRSNTAANDFATTAEVITEVLENYHKLGQQFSYGCCIYPTAPLLKKQYLKEACSLLEDSNFDTVLPVLKYSYPIWRSLKIESGKATMNWPEHLNSRSQDLPPSYHDAGQFYWFKVASYLSSKKLLAENSGVIELNELEVQDIDNETDWKLAELKYKLIHHIG
jgi:pseudaminic acid cytidylyltransferase